jgi:predicted O-methyltransferase YrrM
MRDRKFYRIFDYNKSLLPNAHLASLENQVDSTESARDKTGASIGFPGWGILYYLLLSHLDRERDELIIETGTNEGCTTIILAQALLDAKCSGKVATIELNPENIEKAKLNFERAGVDSRIDLHEGSSFDVLPKILGARKDIRFAFLDASHFFDDVRREFEIVLPHLADDALVLFDNTYKIARKNEDQRVNGFLQSIKNQYGGNLINLEFVSWFTPGLAIWQKAPKL